MQFQKIHLLVPRPPKFYRCQHFSYKKSALFCQICCLYPKQQYESCVRDFLVLFSGFIKHYQENVSFIQLQIGHKQEKRKQQHVSLVKFSYWLKFHVNIMTCSGVMTIFVYKGLTRNLKSKIPPSEFCPISENLGELGIKTGVTLHLENCV